MIKRYDWPKLKALFVSGGWITIADFFKAQHIENNSRNRSHSKGWKEERLEYQGKIITQVQTQEIESIIQVRLRQQQIAKQMQEVGLKKLEQLEPQTADQARKLINSGLEQERAALGISERGGGTSLTQVNVNLPKTKFDELLDGQDLESVLKLLAQVREEKMRRKLLNNQSNSDNLDTKE